MWLRITKKSGAMFVKLVCALESAVEVLKKNCLCPHLNGSPQRWCFKWSWVLQTFLFTGSQITSDVYTGLNETALEWWVSDVTETVYQSYFSDSLNPILFQCQLLQAGFFCDEYPSQNPYIHLLQNLEEEKAAFL